MTARNPDRSACYAKIARAEQGGRPSRAQGSSLHRRLILGNAMRFQPKVDNILAGIGKSFFDTLYFLQG